MIDSEATSLIALGLSAASVYFALYTASRQYYFDFSVRILDVVLELAVILRRFSLSQNTMTLKEATDIQVRVIDLIAHTSLLIPSRHISKVQDPLFEFLIRLAKDLDTWKIDETHQWDTGAYGMIFQRFLVGVRIVNKVDRFTW